MAEYVKKIVFLSNIQSSIKSGIPHSNIKIRDAPYKIGLYLLYGNWLISWHNYFSMIINCIIGVRFCFCFYYLKGVDFHKIMCTANICLRIIESWIFLSGMLSINIKVRVYPYKISLISSV